MTEASWGDTTKSPEINWRMSASLENVPCGDSDVAEVTSLEGAIRAWLELDPAHRDAANLNVEHAIQTDGVSISIFAGEDIAVLSERLPSGQ
jgi:hypothetical protein